MHPERLGPYFVDELIGKGGMGCVYRATHRDTGDIAAIKALASNLAASDGFRERFQSEIDSLKKLRHAGIVRLLGHGEEEGALFYAMELVDGPSLEQELRRGRRFTWQETAQLAIQVSRALKHAHDHGVVHRDIKPANLLLTARGDVKIADFGIARLFGASGMTIAGGVLGTADYMSPEQASGDPVTARCDQYALGCVMYVLLAHRTPFRAADVAAMLHMQRWATPDPVTRYAPDTPKQLDDVIQQLLSKDPADRFPNTKVLAKHLEAMLKAFARPKEDAFELSDSERPKVASSVLDAGLAETRDAGIAATPAESLPPDDDVTPEAPDETGAKSLVSAADDPLVTASSSYIEVSEESLASAPLVRSSLGPLLLTAVIACAAGGVVWWSTRPLGADQLFDEIEAIRAADEAPGAALRLSDKFVDGFPSDPRIERVEEYRREFQLRAMRKRTALSLWLGERLGRDAKPEELLYRHAMSLRERSPDRAAAALEALAKLADQPPVEDDGARQASPLAELARSEAAELRRRRDAEFNALMEYTTEQLAAARTLLRSGAPAEAAELARAIATALPPGPRMRPLVASAEQLAAEAESQASAADGVTQGVTDAERLR